MHDYNYKTQRMVLWNISKAEHWKLYSRTNKKKMTVPTEEVTAKYVPAAAVIRMSQALSGFIGRKARLGGYVSLM